MNFRHPLYLMLFALPALAQAQQMETIDTNTLATPVLLAHMPRFPSSLPSGKERVQVRLKGTISERGVMETAVFESEPGEEAFADAIKPVLAHWRFRPALAAKGCKPVASEAVAYVWVEEKNGRMTFSVSTAPEPTAGPASAVAKYKWRNYVQPPQPEYPTRARRAAFDGTAEIAMTFNSKGDMVHSELVYSIPISDFGDALESAARFVKLEPGESPEPGRDLCVIQAINFCLQDGAPRYSTPYCDRKRK